MTVDVSKRVNHIDFMISEAEKGQGCPLLLCARSKVNKGDPHGGGVDYSELKLTAASAF